MTSERQDEIERDIITKEEREQYIRDQDLITGKGMAGCRRALIILAIGTILMVAMFCSKHSETLLK